MTKCQYYNSCNGCSCQHIDYNVQLENKRKVLAQIVKKDDVKVFSGNEYHYRNRMEFIFNSYGPGLRGKNSIINVDKCLIANERINELLLEIKDFFKDVDYFDFKTKMGTFCYAVIRTAKTDSISFVLNSDSTKLNPAIEKIKEFSGKTTANSIIITYTSPDMPDSTSEDFFVIKGSDQLEETIMGNNFEYSVQGFFQNNIEVAKQMHKYCNEILKVHSKDTHLLDLYAGVGTFGINNANLFCDVTIIESFKGCIDSANENLKKNNISNAKTIVMDAKRIKNLEIEEPLVIIIDPPRSGMHPDTISQINKFKPISIIYISCNIRQMAKDLKKFKQYKVKSAALFDQFPHTNHSEAIVELI